MTTSECCIIATIITYLATMLCVGFYYSRRSSSSEEFYLGGRKLGPIVTAMSAEASDMSSWLLMGLPGLAYLGGISVPFWTAMGLAVGTYLNWLIVAKRLRQYSVKLGAITIPDFIFRRYRDDSKILSCAAVMLILVFFVPYTASGFKAIGMLFNGLFDVDYHAAMIVGAIVVVGYTVLGGFMAVSMTDLIQSVVMSAALLFIVFFGVQQTGGWAAILENVKALPGYLDLTNNYNIATGAAHSHNVSNIISILAWGLGYFGMPHILLRFMAIDDVRQLKFSRRIASTWVVISMFTAILIGIIGHSMSAAGKIASFTASAEAETVIIRLAALLSQNGVLCSIIAGMVLTGILACTMSTADSQLLTAASSVSQDLFQGFFRMKLGPRTSMLVARGTVMIIAAIGVVLAWDPENSIFGIVAFAWAGFGATFGPVILFALFWKRSTKWGALAGMLTGCITVFVWKYGISHLGGAWDIYELLPAFIASCIAIVVTSLSEYPKRNRIINLD